MKKQESMVDLKELMEDRLIAFQTERYFKMTLEELQREADKIGFDISTIF